MPIEAGAEPKGDVYSRSDKELTAMRAAELDAPRWILPFLDAGLHVLFELPKPVLRAHPFQCVDWFNRNNPDCAGGLSESRSDMERYRKPIVDAINRIAATYRGISTWDPLPILCVAESCNALEKGRPLYFDADHLSPYGNLVLLRSFREAIDALGAEK